MVEGLWLEISGFGVWPVARKSLVAHGTSGLFLSCVSDGEGTGFYSGLTLSTHP